MSNPNGYRDRANDSLFSLIGEVPDLVKRYISAEIDAAKTWVAKVSKDAGIGAAWFAAALFVLFWTVPAIGFFVIALLSIWLPLWASALILIGAMLVVMLVLVILGIARMKKLVARENPIKTVSEDAKKVKEIAGEL